MAAGLMRHHADGRINAYSAGTHPGTALNALSVQSLQEVGADLGGEAPRPVDPDLVEQVDLVITLGREARLDTGQTEQRNWDTHEPSLRGIGGIERMRLIRDDIDTRVRQLIAELVPASA